MAAIVLVSPGIRVTMPKPVFWVVGWALMLLPHAVGRKILEAFNGGPRKKHLPLLPGARGEAQQACWTRDYPIESTRHPVGLFLICRRVSSARPATGRESGPRPQCP